MPRLPHPKNLRIGIKDSPFGDGFEPCTGEFGCLEYDKTKEFLPIIEWTHCRDIFQFASSRSIAIKGMWFCHHKGAAENVCAFIERIEERLNLKNWTTFRKTNYDNILWIKPQPFWIRNYVRRSFFTMALRAGSTFKRMKHNYEEVLYYSKVANGNCTPAIKRFLNGHTKYTLENPKYNAEGWDSLFRNVPHWKVEYILV